MISRVFNERERVEVLDAIDAMEEAIEYAEAKGEATGQQERAAFQEARIRELLELARIGSQLLENLVRDARVDGSALMKVLLGTGGDAPSS
jgi:hypothetical protein